MATGETERDQSDRLPDAVVADILASDRRRSALAILAAEDEPMVIDDLAAAVRAREEDTPPTALSPEERRTARDDFFAEPLPKLTATGVVDYDSMVGTVTLRDDDRILDRLS